MVSVLDVGALSFNDGLYFDASSVDPSLFSPQRLICVYNWIAVDFAIAHAGTILLTLINNRAVVGLLFPSLLKDAFRQVFDVLNQMQHYKMMMQEN